MLRTLALFTLVVYVVGQNRAIVKLEGKGNGVSGSVTFSEENGIVTIEGQVTGLEQGLHGFHVHALGDLSDGCASTGGHFNPEKKNHGAPNATERHVGDLGNIVADHTGTAHFHFTDKIIALHGQNNILGRAVVVHSGEDDLGLGGEKDSLTTGHAGNRVACGIIGILHEDRPAPALLPESRSGEYIIPEIQPEYPQFYDAPSAGAVFEPLYIYDHPSRSFSSIN